MASAAKDVATLRERTGCRMMDCRKALTESDSDMDAAADTLREKSLATINKRSSRIATEGVVYTQINALGNVIMVVEINAETDSVAKNAELRAFVETVAGTVEKQNPTDVGTLLNLTASGLDKKVDDLLKEEIQTIGENIKIRRLTRVEGLVVSYTHANGRIGVIAQFGISAGVAVRSEPQECVKNITMQAAAVDPSRLNEQAVPAGVVEHKKKILTEQVINDDEPTAIAKEIVVGRLSKFLKDICPADQVYVEDSDKNVQQYIDSIAKEPGGEITIKAFARSGKSEGLERKEDSSADEVASMMK